jgi:hypothetical protein
MMMRRGVLGLLAAIATGLSFAPSSPVAAEPVDVELVLAVDTSGSIDPEEYQMQHEGYAAALTNADIIEAIRSGPHHAIAITFVEWSGFGHQRQLVGWTLIKDAQSAGDFAAKIKHSNRVFSDWTSISDAIDYSVSLFKDNGLEGDRLVVDISGDGVNNNGRPPSAARDDAVAKGVTINGLPILNEDPSLDGYYQENVIGGDGAFRVAVNDFDSFTEALRGKLMREIAGRRTPPGPIDVAAADAAFSAGAGLR